MDIVKYCLLSFTHFPTELKQCRKFLRRGNICFLKAKRVYLKTLLTVKSKNSGFLSFFMSKLRNFETRFQARDTWPRVLWVPGDSPWVVDTFRQWNFSISSTRTGVIATWVKGYNFEKCGKILLPEDFQIFCLHPSTKMAITPSLAQKGMDVLPRSTLD